MKTLTHFRNQLARSYGHLSWAQVKNKVRRSELDVSDLVAFCDEANRLFYEQQVELSKTEMEWISVKDRLPDNGVYVIVRFKDGCIGIDYLASFYKGVTHWMPLPDKPKQ